jgi:hypothetical protein
VSLVRSTARTAAWWRGIVRFCILYSVISAGCREDLHTEEGRGSPPRPTLRLRDYYGFTNWIRDPDGRRIPESRFRNSWFVVDTAGSFGGFTDVRRVVDSTFAVDQLGRDSLAGTRFRYFRTDSAGAFLEFGYLARLLHQRDTVSIPATWDTLFASSSSWVVQRSDSLGVFSGTLQPQRDLAETDLNGMRTILATSVVIVNGPNVSLQFWVSDTPAAILRFRDVSPVPFNRLFSELSVLRTGP